MGAELFEMSWVQGIMQFFNYLAWTLYVIGLIVACFECGINYAGGKGDIRAVALNAIKGFMAASLFSVVPVRLYQLAISLQAEFTSGMTGYGTSIGEVAANIIQEYEEIETVADLVLKPISGFEAVTSPIMVIVCIIMMAYAVIKVFFANLKRSGILLIQIAVGSLYMFSIPRGGIDAFVQWMKQVIGVCLTAFLQATILIAGLLVFKEHALLGIGLMLSSSEITRIAGAFGLDTSTRANIMSAVYTAQTAVHTGKAILRLRKRKGVKLMDEKKKNLCAMIPESLHIKVREEQEQLALTLSEYVEKIIREHFEGGKTMANGTRTLALQIPVELFVRIKEHLNKYGLTQKEFIIGLIETALTDAADAEEAETE